MPENKNALFTKENTREIQEVTSVVVPYLLNPDPEFQVNPDPDTDPGF
jgi:hypothetical protein